MQMLPQYFLGAGVDPSRDIYTAGAYLASLAKRFGGDWTLALAAYDWGPGSLAKWRKDGGTLDTLPPETRKYVLDITADVPLHGVLTCKTQSPISPPGGPPPSRPPQAAASASSSDKSLWGSLTGIFKSRSVPNLPAPSQPSAPPLPDTSFLKAAVSEIAAILKPQGVTMSTPSASQSFLNLILSDVLSTGGSPLLTFLAAFGSAAGDPVKITEAWVAFQGAEIGALPALEATLSQQLASFLSAKVQASMAKPA